MFDPEQLRLTCLQLVLNSPLVAAIKTPQEAVAAAEAMAQYVSGPEKAPDTKAE